MRQCPCGGVIREHELTGERTAWTCSDCGRYDAIKRAGCAPKSAVSTTLTDFAGSDSSPAIFKATGEQA